MKEDEMGLACSIHGEVTNAFRILVGNCEGKRSLGRHLGMGESLMLKWILGILDLGECLRIGTSCAFCELGNDHR
jgi:hypothetical protein